MNWLDLVIIVCLTGGLIKGLFDGFIKQVISFLALIAGIFFAGRLVFPVRRILSQFFSEDIVSPQLFTILSYLLAFILIIAVISFIGHLVSNAIKATPAKPLNMLLGGVFGFGLWILTLSIFINIITFFDKNSQIISKQTQEKSVLYSKVKAVIPTVYPFIKNYLDTINKEKPEVNNELLI